MKSEDTAAPITLLQRIEVMTLQLRADRARREKMQHAERESPMVTFAMGGGFAEIARLRAVYAKVTTMNATLAREVAALREELQHYRDAALLIPREANDAESSNRAQ